MAPQALQLDTTKVRFHSQHIQLGLAGLFFHSRTQADVVRVTSALP